MSDQYEDEILNSWRKNVTQWSHAIANEEIVSRVGVTNQAILDAVFADKVSRLLDIGCGEGWLVRAAAARGVSSFGIDGVEEFIKNQTCEENTRYFHVDYRSLSPRLFPDLFDVIVCNFSLLGDSSVRTLLQQIPSLLEQTSGRLIVQTLHPEYLDSREPNKSGWRTSSWQGFSDTFVEPYPWYFRTINDWLVLFKQCGLDLVSTVEPRPDKSSDPVSILFSLTV